MIFVIPSGARDLAIEARSTQIIWRDQSPFVRSFTPFRMTTWIAFTWVAATAIFVSTPLRVGSQNANAASEIRIVLKSQQDAWNRGDIDAFMNGYWHSDQTVFVSGDEVTRGWQALAQNSELAGQHFLRIFLVFARPRSSSLCGGAQFEILSQLYGGRHRAQRVGLGKPGT